MNAKAAIRSLRIRTTPLVLSGVAMGVTSALVDGSVNWLAALFLALTAVFLQFVSNLSNELGDSLNGTDRADREGMRYSLQSGIMTVRDMKILIASCVVLSCVSGILMILFSFGTLFCLRSFSFIILGAFAIVAAMRYTLGRNPYGYRGMGDLYVFLFFGLAVVCGGCYLVSDGHVFMISIMPACAMGCFSTGVLNVNNIRDMKTDAETRVTMAIRMGEKGARLYHGILMVSGWLFLIVWSALYLRYVCEYAYLLALPLFVMHMVMVVKRTGKALDPMVPMLSMSSFLLSVLALAGVLLRVR